MVTCDMAAAIFSTTSAWMSRWTMSRDPAEQVCPAFWMMERTSDGTAASISASEKTMFADFPPSSRTVGTTRSAAAWAMAEPVCVDPTKPRCATPGWALNAAPASAPSPVTTLKAPAGKPTEWMSSANRTVERGVSSAGLATAQLPVASEVAAARPMSWSG